MIQSWQRLVDGVWTAAIPPSGGLLRKSNTSQDLPDSVIIEMIGPEGPQGPPGPPGSGDLLIAEVLPIEFQDGVNNTFPLSTDADLSQAFQVFRNGLLEIPGYGFLVTPTHVTLTTPPLDSDVLTVIYQKAQ